MPDIPPEVLERLQVVIGLSMWRWAKTYAKKAPHYYTLRREAREPEDFDFLAECIDKYAVIGTFYGHPFKYLYLDQWKYWHMGDLVNRDLREGVTTYDGGRG